MSVPGFYEYVFSPRTQMKSVTNRNALKTLFADLCNCTEPYKGHINKPVYPERSFSPTLTSKYMIVPLCSTSRVGVELVGIA